MWTDLGVIKKLNALGKFELQKIKDQQNVSFQCASFLLFWHRSIIYGSLFLVHHSKSVCRCVNVYVFGIKASPLLCSCVVCLLIL
jgi:hypothetical protein